MKKQPTVKYEVSLTAAEIIQQKADSLGISERAVLEYIIMEFSPSSQYEKHRAAVRRGVALKKFLKAHPKASLKTAWGAGFSTGWLHFQIRKESSPFKVEE
jgi:hypothetical protein